MRYSGIRLASVRICVPREARAAKIDTESGRQAVLGCPTTAAKTQGTAFGPQIGGANG